MFLIMNITITERDDGFGAQFQHIIFGIIYAQMNGFTYIHKPITRMAHNYENDPHFIEKIEDFLNIRKHYKTTADVSHVESVGFWPLYHFITGVEDSNKERFHYCLKNDNGAIEKIKRIFFENKTNPYDSSVKNVAVHIRRPNIGDDRLEGADTPDEYYLNLMEHVRQTTRGEILFHIYSQNTLDSEKYRGLPYLVFHIDDTVTNTFLGLVFADVLIASKSALSYCAGLLTNGTVYTMKYVSELNPLKEDWNVCSPTS